MLLLVGLGNPGSNYTNTRHNIGFKIIDAINAHFKLSKQKPKFKGLLTTGNIDEKKIYAIKPLTFMNNSGTAIKELIDYFKIDAKDVIVFHDDMDIDFGKIKAKFGGSSAGHNGIESIDKFIGKDYSRVRIGIGHPKQKKKVNNHVLEDFKEEKKQPIDYRRSGVLTLFAGIGLFLFGVFFINLLKGIGLLVGAIGVGQIIAGYLYPNDSAEITKAVENFEKK